MAADLAAVAGVTWRCFGTNKNGSPVHPLYQRLDAQLVELDRGQSGNQ